MRYRAKALALFVGIVSVSYPGYLPNLVLFTCCYSRTWTRKVRKMRLRRSKRIATLRRATEAVRKTEYTLK